MINKKAKVIGIIMILALALTGCTQEIPQKIPEKTLPSETKDPVVAVINLPTAGPQARTILPSDLELADHYTITLTNEKSQEAIVLENIKPNDKSQLEIRNVPVGNYKVHIDGLNTATPAQVILKGDGDKVLEIALNTIGSTTVELFPQCGPDLKGSISVTFDWTAMVTKADGENPSDSAAQETVGPLTQAINDGYLEFELYAGKLGTPLVKTGDTVIWNTKDTTSQTCVFSGVPTGKNIYTALSVKDKEGNVIIDKQYGITAHVYADQTSYYNGDINHKIHLDSSMDMWYSNINNLTVTYPKEGADTSFIINWNDLRRKGESIFDEVRLSYGFYNVAEAERKEVKLEAFKPTANREDNKVLVTGLDSSKEYYIKSQTVSKGGKLSDTVIWTLSPGKGFKTKVNLGGITFDPKYKLPASLTTGETFEIRADITNANATYPTLEYKVVDLAKTPGFEDSNEAIFFVDNPADNQTPAVFTANRPGVAKVMATNNDANDPDYQMTSEAFVKVSLNKPLNIATDLVDNIETSTRGINVTWSPVEHAEQYIVYRSVNSGDFLPVGEPVSTNELLDADVNAGTAYQYKVVATAPGIDAEYNDPTLSYSSRSAESDLSAPVELPVPSIQIKPTVITEGKFELVEITEEGEKNHVYSDLNKKTGNIGLFISLEAGESKTVGLENAMEGFDKYTWFADTNLVVSGNFLQAGSIVLSDQLDAIDPGLLGAHTITFIAENTTTEETYSASIGLTLVTAPVKSVTGSIKYKFTEKEGFVITDNVRYSTADAKGRLMLSGKAFAANGETPSVQSVQYRLADPLDKSKATIDPYTGIIDVLDFGTVSFEVYSPENDTIKDTITLTFYKPTVKSADSLVSQFNAKFSDFITDANSYHRGDWWEGTGGPYKSSTYGVWRNTGTPQKYNGGIEFYNHPMTLEGLEGNIGDVTLNCKKIIFAADKGGAGYAGTSPLRTIGVDGNFNNTVEIQLPNNQGKAYIKFNNVDVRADSAAGSYSVWFEHEIITAPGTALNSTKKNPSTVNATLENRPRIK